MHMFNEDRAHRSAWRVGAILMLAATVACGAGGSSTAPASTGSPAATPTVQTVQLYKDGFYFPWAGGSVAANGAGSIFATNPKAAVTDNLTGDQTVLLVSAFGQGTASSASFILNGGNYRDMAAFYPAGHLLFNIKLAPGIQFSSINVIGYAQGGQFGSAALSISSLSTTSFVRVSVPIALIYPPAAISTSVALPFYLSYTATLTGSNVPTIYLNDIKWTSN